MHSQGKSDPARKLRTFAEQIAALRKSTQASGKSAKQLTEAMKYTQEKLAAFQKCQFQKAIQEFDQVDQGVDMAFGGGEFGKFYNTNELEYGKATWENQWNMVKKTETMAQAPVFTFQPAPPPPELTPLQWLSQQVDEICQLAHAV